MKNVIKNCHYVAINEDGRIMCIISPKSMTDKGVKNALESELDEIINKIVIKVVSDNAYKISASTFEYDEEIQLVPAGFY